jgi:hypothetical protein
MMEILLKTGVKLNHKQKQRKRGQLNNTADNSAVFAQVRDEGYIQNREL